MSLSPKLLTAAVLLALSGAAAAKVDAGIAGRAEALIRANGNAVHAAPNDGFVAVDTIQDRVTGGEYARFQRTYAGMPVIGGDFVVQSGRDGKLRGVSQTLTSNARPSLKGAISADQAIVEAGAQFGIAFTGTPNARQVVYARGAAPVLAYEVRLNGTKADQTPTEMVYYVDARNGKILDSWDTVHTAAAAGTGQTLTLGTVGITTNSVTGGYQLTDPTRGGGYTLDANNAATTTTTGTVFNDADNTWGNFTKTDRATAAADAHFGVAATWDFYVNSFGRSGIKNNGIGAKSLVHVGSNWVNASWSDSCFCMRYGDGDGVTYQSLVALDVAGHEMTHGVTAATSGLAYSADAGGLNESTSDVMGTMVEWSVANANDPGDYLIGEKIYISNPNNTKALRAMFKQNIDGVSFVCYPTRGFKSSPQHDPHYTSGVGNRAFYLMSEGAVVPAGFGAGTTYNLTPASLVCNGNTGIAKIGRAAAAAVWYRALDLYFTSSTTYPQARAHMLHAATDLYGAGSAQYNGVAAAWSASGVN
jgi:Zn-dependent metalloprotease